MYFHLTWATAFCPTRFERETITKIVDLFVSVDIWPVEWCEEYPKSFRQRTGSMNDKPQTV